MGRTANLSPLGLFTWDSTLFDLMVIPSALDKETLVNNLLAETAELEVLYANPVVMKNLIGVWSNKNLDVWNRLYETTQYDYNPIENYNRYETGSDGGSGSTTHSGADTATEATTHDGSDGVAVSKKEGGTQSDATGKQVVQSGSDSVTGADTKGHWIAGYDSAASGQDDGLVKQTRDQDDATSTTTYGKHEDTTGSLTTTFGKTEDINELKNYGERINKQNIMTHGEKVTNTQEGTHELHAHGNIGVTTTQKLVREQREIDLFNVYDIIIEDFKMRFCILVY